MMKILHICFVVLFASGVLFDFQKTQAAEPLFFESLYDVPVMSGLTEVTEMSLSFDKVDGRIAYAAAVSENIDENAVLTFYGKALPQMGWQRITSKIFKREKEKLEISFEKVNTMNLVKFSLRPALK